MPKDGTNSAMSAISVDLIPTKPSDPPLFLQRHPLAETLHRISGLGGRARAGLGLNIQHAARLSGIDQAARAGHEELLVPLQEIAHDADERLGAIRVDVVAGVVDQD